MLSQRRAQEPAAQALDAGSRCQARRTRPRPRARTPRRRCRHTRPCRSRQRSPTNSPADAAVRGSSRSLVELYGRRATGVRLAQFELWCRPEWSCRPRQGARHHDRGGDRRTDPASHRGLTQPQRRITPANLATKCATPSGTWDVGEPGWRQGLPCGMLPIPRRRVEDTWSIPSRRRWYVADRPTWPAAITTASYTCTVVQ
jgi:hypothetical protein